MATPHYKSVATIGSAIPLAIALLHSAIVPSNGKDANTQSTVSTSTVEPVVCADDIEDYLACHSEIPNRVQLDWQVRRVSQSIQEPGTVDDFATRSTCDNYHNGGRGGDHQGD
jgi:hypothetical protein